MKKIWLLILLVFTLAMVGCGQKQNSDEITIKGKIILATTTSTRDTGLLDVLLPQFTQDTGWEVELIAVGTGAALQMGRDAEADALLVHAKTDEIKFVNDGYGVKRYPLMYNDFVLIGPKEPVQYNNDIKATLTQILNDKLTFVSRGDDSGTHKAELRLWKASGLEDRSAMEEKYVSAGQGMGATITMANEMQGYTISDRATFLTSKDKITLDIVCEKDTAMLNYYGVIQVNPEKSDKINAEGGKAFVDWILSDKALKMIETFGVDKYGQPLFTVNTSDN